MRPSWIAGRNDFSNSESLSRSDASHQVSAQSNLRFRRRCRWKNFKMAALAAILDIGTERNSTILNLYVAPMPPIHFRLNPTYGLGGDVIWRISRWPHAWRPSWISEQNDLAILNLYVVPMPPIKFRLNPTYGLGGDVVWRLSRWPPRYHLEYRNWTISAILNLYVTVMPPIKFRLHPTCGLGVDFVGRISRWLPWRPSLISEQINFSNSESPCCHNASH